jgi:indolepyruvate ferredoxin oxidoreductase beta subunit
MIISVEPMESLRYLPWLSSDGWLVTNITPFVNIPNYPAKEDVIAEIKKRPKHIIIDADFIAKEMGSARSANMVVLGAASPFLDIEFSYLEFAIKQLFGSKGEKVVQTNIDAFVAGEEFARNYIK